MARSRAFYVLAVALFPLVLTGFLTLLVFASGAVQRDDGIGHETKFARISYPTPEDRVSEKFEVSGSIDSIPASQVVYLVERVDGRFWPKKRLGASPTSFSRSQHASTGEGYKYTIELLSLDAGALKRIENWFETGKQTGKYPGISNTDGVTVLAKVRVMGQ